MSGTNIVKYQGLDLATVDAVGQQVDAISGGNYETIEVGENVYRFLPVPDGQSPIRVTAMHYIDAIPGLDGKTIVFACPRVELKTTCAACAKSEELMKTGNPVDRERAWRISAGLRVYANVINRKKPENGPRVLSFGKQIWTQLQQIRKNPRMGGDFTDPSSNGFDIIITREGTGKNDTKYTVAADRQNSPLAASDEEINNLILATKNLEQEVNPSLPEELLLAWGVSARQPAGSLVAGARAAAQAAVGTVGAGVMRGRSQAQVPAQLQQPAPAQVVSQIPAGAVPAQAASSALTDADDDFNV